MWKLAAVANAAIAVGYIGIAVTLFRGLTRTNQLRTNRLALATAAIFFSCGIGHGAHFAHLIEPLLGVRGAPGIAMRDAYDLHLIMIDVVTAFVAAWYWSLRSQYTAFMNEPTLFADLRGRQQQALQFNDDIVQGLAVAKYALAAGDTDGAAEAVDNTLEAAKHIVADLLGDRRSQFPIHPGDLVRTRPADVTSPPNSRLRLP
jgi:hypothetical protein